MDYFKETEELLYSVPKKERAITQMEKRKARLMAKGAPTIPAGLDYTKPYVKASFASETINDLCELAHVCACIEATRQELEEIKNCVEEIADAELKTCLKLWYWARLSKEKIALHFFTVVKCVDDNCGEPAKSRLYFFFFFFRFKHKLNEFFL